MVISPEVEPNPLAHLFWYTEVIGVSCAEAQHTGVYSQDLNWKTMDFLWVQWLGIKPDYIFDHYLARLPKIGFVFATDEIHIP